MKVILFQFPPFIWLSLIWIASGRKTAWQKILEFFANLDTCVKEGNTFWRTKAALEALVDHYRSSDDEDYRLNLWCGLKSVIRIRD
jgi:hypothetical protein